jgi:hypothetical protein
VNRSAVTLARIVCSFMAIPHLDQAQAAAQ